MQRLEEFLHEMETIDAYGIDFEALNVRDISKFRAIGVGLGTYTDSGKRDKYWYISFDDKYHPNSLPMTKTFSILHNLLNNPEKSMIAFNAKFELWVFRYYNIRPKNQIICPMVATWVLDENRKKVALKSEVKKEFDHEMINFQDTILGDSLFSTEPLDTYCIDDVRQSNRLWRKRKKQLERTGLLKMFLGLEMKVPWGLATIEQVGLGFNYEKAEIEGKKFNLRKLELEKEIHTLGGREINVNSDQQVANLLFNDLKLPIRSVFDETEFKGKERVKKYITADGGYSVSAKVLEHYKDYEIVQKLMEQRKCSKLVSTYYDKLVKLAKESHDGRIRPRMNQNGTVTSRLSSSNPNGQNMPSASWYRELFYEPDDNYLLVGADYGQLELRICAHICKKLLGYSTYGDDFEKGLDPHQGTANLLGKLLGKEMPRSAGKMCNFSLIYGKSIPGFAAEYMISIEEATQQWNAFHGGRPDINQIIDFYANRISTFGYVETIFGFRRRYKKHKGKSPSAIGWDAKVAWNAVVQGSGGQIGKLAVYKVEKAFHEAGLDAVPILQIHDEILCRAHKDCAEEAAKLLKHTMENVVQLAYPLDVDAKIGKTWADCK